MRTHRLSAAAVTLIALLAGTTLFASTVDPIFVSAPTVASGPVSASAVIDGLRGGRVAAGRFAVRVPRGAFVGKAYVTVTVPNPAVMRCNLDISPPATNGFLVPAILEADCSGTSAARLLDIRTITFDEKLRLWRLLPAVTLSLDGKTVQTPLWHFSKYGQVEGKAGW